MTKNAPFFSMLASVAFALLALGPTEAAEQGASAAAPAAQTSAQLASDKKLWLDAGIHDYTFTLSRHCYCIPEEKIVVVVKNDAIASATFTPSGKPLDPERAKSLPTVSSLFATLEENLPRPMAKSTWSANAETRHLEKVFIEINSMISDASYGYTLSDFSRP
jgi:hypothetical protein